MARLREPSMVTHLHVDRAAPGTALLEVGAAELSLVVAPLERRGGISGAVELHAAPVLASAAPVLAKSNGTRPPT